ncbi:DsbA family protein [Actinomyces qiguomingii]|uniref:DsbA family protein n=1 Tax=Actinomyces qiguomingii TaxID=2057800 RepID=UPI001E623A7F|nr:thioredoxin domain-containing protein [Actinomyces qiguomingii]
MASNQPRPTKAERREAARAKARALREEEERRERRARITRRSLLGIGGLAVAGTVAAVVVNGRNDESKTPGGAIVTDNAGGKGVPATIRADGSLVFGPDLTPGTSTDGAQNLHIYFDYACHHCADFEILHNSEIETLLGEGTINLVLHPSRLLQSSWSDMVCNGLGVVLDQEPASAMAFHLAAMTRFSEIYASADFSTLTAESVVQAATEAGVSEAVVEQITAAVTENTYGAWLDLGDKTFLDLGIGTTPTVYLGKEKLDLASISTQTGITDHLQAGADSAPRETSAQ